MMLANAKLADWLRNFSELEPTKLKSRKPFQWMENDIIPFWLFLNDTDRALDIEDDHYFDEYDYEFHSRLKSYQRFDKIMFFIFLILILYQLLFLYFLPFIEDWSIFEPVPFLRGAGITISIKCDNICSLAFDDLKNDAEPGSAYGVYDLGYDIEHESGYRDYDLGYDLGYGEYEQALLSDKIMGEVRPGFDSLGSPPRVEIGPTDDHGHANPLTWHRKPLPVQYYKFSGFFQ